MLEIKQDDFVRLTAFILNDYGINLTHKKNLIEGRLGKTITDMGFSNFTQYVDHILKTKSKNDLDVLINRVTTNHTFFMRENSHFEFFSDVILPEVEKSSRNRSPGIWSAACSSGEEPYTMSIILCEFFGKKPQKWDIRMLATDISQRVLKTAKAGTYSEESLKELPEAWKKKYFTKSGSEYTVTKQLRDNIVFKEFNLMDPIKFKTTFDVIFCRNVMIYFDQQTKDALVQRFYNVLNPGGYLLIGHSETLNKATSPFKYLMPATFRKV
ncbi:MAG: protein-glutamate O-methyltransferase CheR [Clostridiales bacterium]|nr:protein-glutamate O-methyltransferase CheR [Clostridiales bacterium]